MDLQPNRILIDDEDVSMSCFLRGMVDGSVEAGVVSWRDSITGDVHVARYEADDDEAIELLEEAIGIVDPEYGMQDWAEGVDPNGTDMLTSPVGLTDPTEPQGHIGAAEMYAQYVRVRSMASWPSGSEDDDWGQFTF